jgi:hypothetical protein
MDAESLTAKITESFGRSARVRARRPRSLYQVEIPAFLSDGDAAQVYLREIDSGEVEMTDLGHTTMRLSYTRKISAEVEEALTRLGERHGFRFESGEFSARMPFNEITAGAIGLAQIEAAAEAVVEASARHRVSERRFREMVRTILRDAFREACEFDYFDRVADPQGNYAIDALVRPGRNALVISVVPSQMEAERAVGNRLFLEPYLKEPHHWVALPRDINKLPDKTRARLMSSYLVPVPSVEQEPDAVPERLRQLAA